VNGECTDDTLLKHEMLTKATCADWLIRTCFHFCIEVFQTVVDLSNLESMRDLALDGFSQSDLVGTMTVTTMMTTNTHTHMSTSARAFVSVCSVCGKGNKDTLPLPTGGGNKRINVRAKHGGCETR
jgi:hypothetical protein